MRSRGFGIIEGLVALMIIGIAVLVCWGLWLAFGPAKQPRSQSAPTPAATSAPVTWGIKVQVGNEPTATVTPAAPIATPTTSPREAELEARLKKALVALAAADRQVESDRLLLLALARLEDGDLVQAQSDLHRWAAEQVSGYEREIVLSTPLPQRAKKLLAPYVVAKHFNRDGQPRWIVKLTRDDEAMARLR